MYLEGKQIMQKVYIIIQPIYLILKKLVMKIAKNTLVYLTHLAL